MDIQEKFLSPNQLKPHPCNSSIYGQAEDVSDLVEMIRASGWVKPIVCTASHMIVSGHRRWKAALELGLETVPVEIREFADEIAELEALLLENASRIKTVEQKVREGEAWSLIETYRAKQRQQQAAAKTNQKLGRDSSKTLMENFPQASKGTTRDAIASRVGLGSGRTYEKAAKVVQEIDSLWQDTPETANALRKVLNEQSVDAAHRIVRQPAQKRQKILSLIASGIAKSTRKAEKIVQENSTQENSPASFQGFCVGDLVEVNAQAESFKQYIGRQGQVDQVLADLQQISVNLETGPNKIRFYSHELTLITKAPPPNPFRVGDIVVVDIDHLVSVSPQEKKWNGFWGKVKSIGQTGSIEVTMGAAYLRLFPRDLKSIDALSEELPLVAERVLRLRQLELDEIEERMLDVIQRREWLTQKQLLHLENIEKLYQNKEFSSDAAVVGNAVNQTLVTDKIENVQNNEGMKTEFSQWTKELERLAQEGFKKAEGSYAEGRRKPTFKNEGLE